MPALRVLSVVLLAGLGAAAAGLAGGTPDDTPSSVTRGALAAPQQRNHAQAENGAAENSAAENTQAQNTQAENARPGSPDWRITTDRGTAPGLSAWASAVSVRPGEQAALHVASSNDQPITVRAFRLGWYGGTGARQVWQATLPPGTAASTQSDPRNWPVRGTADTSGWLPGQYLLRLDAGSASRYVPLLVRSPQLRGALVLVTAPLTGQAENGATTTGTATTGATTTGADRSFDRPYTAGYGAGPLLATDGPIIQLAERDGGPLAYTSDLDLAQGRSTVDGATALVFGSASQYWTAGLRTDVIGAIKRGTNVAFFGAGTGTRRVQLSSDGRTLKVSATLPPATTALTGLRPACTTAASGTAVNLGRTGSWVVQDPQWWGYAQASVTSGEVLPGLVSGNPDGAASQLTDGASVLLAQSPVTCANGISKGSHAATYWTTPAGAGVFTTGTSRWACAAGNTCPRGTGPAVPAQSRKVAAQVTRTVLKVFAEPRAGLQHPA